MQAKPPKPYDGYLRKGLIAAAILIFGFGGWMTFANIEGAVIGGGQVIAESQAKTVQHQDGGIIEDILVRNGDEVETDDILFRLNPTESRSNRQVATNRLLENDAKIARLRTELDGKVSITWPESIRSRIEDPEVVRVIEDQIELFRANRYAVGGQVLQLRERKRQTQEQINGNQSLKQASQRQLESVETELINLKTLESQGYVSTSRVMAMERQKAALQGDISNYDAEVLRLNSAIGELDLQIGQLTRDSRAEILAELRTVETEAADLRAQLETLDDKLQRIEIRAPVSGTIYDLAVTTVGGVVMPGEDLVQIIPRHDNLVIEAKISPRDIDQVYPTQQSLVTLSAFNQRTTPQLHGEVTDISANTLLDEITGLNYYQVTIQIPPEEIARLNGLKLVPGMPADVFIKTGSRTVGSYLLRPFTDTMRRAFRED